MPIYEKHGSKIAIDGTILGIKLSGKYTDFYKLDSLRRVSKHTLTLAGASKPIVADEYKYLTSPDGHQTGYVSNLKTYNGDYTYTYDRMGNIETVKDFTKPKTVYSYDLLGRRFRRTTALRNTGRFGIMTKAEILHPRRFIR